MTKNIIETPKEKTTQERYSKQAYIEAVNNREGFILEAILEDEKSYTKDEVSEIVNAWKSKEVK